ncbi:MAG TPA: KamA family radical SAM protein [Spirochaetota bacterium]|nr:KamA family radical SAM protein [Spirochaetota bacterium]HOM09332.1 KamA family radical SAM protein [Spirochaetota bacterium]HPP49919.1 KamA family radical SAM protein [Spirochaetota bacterium]
MIKEIINKSKSELIELLWQINPEIYDLLKNSRNLDEAREFIMDYFDVLDREFFNIKSKSDYHKMHIIIKNQAKECIRIAKNIMRTENEKICNFSALEVLFKIAKGDTSELEKISGGFIVELIYLFKGIRGQSDVIHDNEVIPSDDHEFSKTRSERLDYYAENMYKRLSQYKTGFDDEIIEQRKKMKQKILKYFGSDEQDWKNYKWHLKNIIRSKNILKDIIKLEEDEIEGLDYAEKYNIPFEITPYYLSLFNENGRSRFDRAIRAQVLPSKTYCENVYNNKKNNIDMDFMGEKSTSPIEGITRRYPFIVILKPVNFCPQICVYCQRNWEIEPSTNLHINKTTLENAINWITNNKNIIEVLVTGGDPLIMTDKYIENILLELSQIKHVERIRIGTRTPVTLPFRIKDDFVKMIKKYHKPGYREICIMTHFEHVAEITPEVIEAVQLIREAGISVYNQQVFTYYNSFKYETSALRRMLKLIGIDPYYTFNTKGKKETIDYRAPIARIEQERKEEARFLPGVIRTDEPVFNVPKLGKSNLRAWQDHDVLMIKSRGERVYRFLPWESNVSLVDDYIYTDIPIYNYLKRLHNDGENVEEYETIFYYY